MVTWVFAFEQMASKFEQFIAVGKELGVEGKDFIEFANKRVEEETKRLNAERD